jgi:hypothetical protein
VGITNNSGIAQTFVAAGDAFGSGIISPAHSPVPRYSRNGTAYLHIGTIGTVYQVQAGSFGIVRV